MRGITAKMVWWKGGTYRAHFLLGLLTLMILCSPLLDQLGIPASVFVTVYAIATGFCGYLLQPNLRWVLFYAVLAVTIAVATYFGASGSIGWVLLKSVTVMLMHVQMFRVVLTHSLLMPKVVAGDRVVAGICGYLILVLMFSHLYEELNRLSPDSYRGVSQGGAVEFIYYSMVTLTTLGYGDIVPVGPFARILSGFQALCGTLYLTIFIATLASKLHFISPESQGK